MSILFFSFANLAAVNASQIESQSNITQASVTDPTIVVNQFEALNSRNLLLNHLELIEDALKSNWATFSNPGTTEIFYSQIGISGIGNELLELYSSMSSDVGFLDLDDEVLDILHSLADSLIDFASVANDTHLLWKISSTNDDISLSHEFGLIGIFDFFIRLAAINSSYIDISTKILVSISDLVEQNSTHIWFEETIPSLVSTTDWFSFGNLEGLVPAKSHYSGNAFGISGLISSLSKYLNLSGVNTSQTNLLIEKSYRTLSSFQIYDSTINATAYLLSPDIANFTSNNIDFGNAGIASALLQAYTATDNVTYLEEFELLINFFNTSFDNFGKYYFFSGFNESGPIIDGIFSGRNTGVTSVLSVLTDYYEFSQHSELLLMMDDIARYLFVYLVDSEYGKLFAPVLFGDLSHGNADTSLMSGTTGIIMTLIRANEYLDNNVVDDTFLEFKETYFEIASANANNIVQNILFDSIAYSPRIGFTGLLTFHNLPAEASFAISETNIVFDNTLIGSSAMDQIELVNTGDRPINFTFSQLSSPFNSSIDEDIVLLDVGEVVNITLGFQPVVEGSFTAEFTIFSSISQNETISLSADSIDFPTISLTSHTNNSELTGRVTFTFGITDQSELKDTSLQVSGPDNYTLAGEFQQSGDAYNYVWDTSALANGTYSVSVVAEDIFDQQSVNEYQFTVINYVTTDPPFVESNIFLFIIVGAIVVLIGASIILVRTMR